MVKEYTRYGPTEAFGIVASAQANSLCLPMPDRPGATAAYVPAHEDVLVWDVKRGVRMAEWHATGVRSQVTCLAVVPSSTKPGLDRRRRLFAVGHEDGSIRLWAVEADGCTATTAVTFNGHRSAITALAFDPSGTLLASGSKDTHVILWDVVSEAGIVKLQGHRDRISSLHFLTPPPVRQTSPESSETVMHADEPATHLLSTSKDTFIKLWDLSTRHCLETVVGHRSHIRTSAIWPATPSHPSLQPDATERSIVFLTGSSDGECKAWTIDCDLLDQGVNALSSSADDEHLAVKFIRPLPSPQLTITTQKISHIEFHPSLPLLAVQSAEKSIEILHLRSPEELRRKQNRREKRKKEKLNDQTEDEPAQDTEQKEQDLRFADRFSSHTILRSPEKIRSFVWPGTSSQDSSLRGTAHTQIFLAMQCNSIEMHSVAVSPKSSDSETAVVSQLHSIELPGHRTDIRSLALSSDDSLLASASNGLLKIWNVRTGACLRTLECGYAVCCMFCPGDRHILIGTKSGELQLFSLASSALIREIKGHDGPIYDFHVRPDQQGIVTGGGDKDVKFWDFEMVSEDGQPPDLSLTHTRTLKMQDDILAVRYSPDSRFLAVSLMDATVKVFYQDTLKFFLSLYGHKLPVLSMSISHDSKLIATCSADKNIKIWGLDFGDCHRSIFAHSDSVMQVCFEPQSHNIWSVGKDALLKHWDGDKFENIQQLEGHHGEIWALAVAQSGDFVITGSHDKSLRVWHKTDEPLFLEEEKERQLEALYETENSRPADLDMVADQSEAVDPTKQTQESTTAGEKLIEAIELADLDRQTFATYHSELAQGLNPIMPSHSPLLQHLQMTAEQYVLSVAERIPSASLHDALLVLPFSQITSLFDYLDHWLKEDTNISLISRILFFLLKSHYNAVVSNKVLRNTMVSLRTNLRLALQSQKDIIGFNLAALKYLRRNDEANRQADILALEERIGRPSDRINVKKRRHVAL